MAIVHYTEASGGLPNSGRLSGTDGDLVGILDVVLVAAGWAIQFTSGTDRVYRPASGNRFVLTVRDAAAISGAANFATVRGAESASGASTYTDTFPTTAELADANSVWCKSSTVSTTARNFDIYASATWVFVIVNVASTANSWDAYFWGDVAPALAGDSYNTVHIHRINQTSPATINGFYFAGAGSGTVNTRMHWARSFDATVKSTCGAIQTVGFANMGAISSYPAYRAGPTTGIDRRKIGLIDGGATTASNSSTLALPIRGWLPNIWEPLHGGPGVATTRDTFSDTSYNASATFKLFLGGASNPWLVMEETDTWSAPTG